MLSSFDVEGQFLKSSEEEPFLELLLLWNCIIDDQMVLDVR